MYTILFGTITLSILHALIPSHWLPLLAISKSNQWEHKKTLWVIFYMGLAHVLSTILLGFIISFLGIQLNKKNEHLFDVIAPIVLIVMGLFFIYRHYTHHHFHIDKNIEKQKLSNIKIITTLVTVMFLSPCLEVESFFLGAAKYGFNNVVLIAAIYAVVSICGMLLWMFIALHGLKKLNWHKIEHNAGLITGFVLILSGILTFFMH